MSLILITSVTTILNERLHKNRTGAEKKVRKRAFLQKQELFSQFVKFSTTVFGYCAVLILS